MARFYFDMCSRRSSWKTDNNIFVFSANVYFSQLILDLNINHVTSSFVLFWRLFRSKLCNPVFQVIKASFWDFSPLFQRREKLCYCVAELNFSLLYHVRSSQISSIPATENHHIIISEFHHKDIRISEHQNTIFMISESESIRIFSSWYQNVRVSEYLLNDIRIWDNQNIILMI